MKTRKNMIVQGLKTGLFLLLLVGMSFSLVAARSLSPETAPMYQDPNQDQTLTYVVRPGDTLGTIAFSFNTTVSAILAANPQITNPNLIYVNQVLTIPLQAGERNVVISPTRGPAGEPVQVTVTGFAPNAIIEVGVGELNAEFTVIVQGRTNSNGRLDTTVLIPEFANENESWVVVAQTTSQPIKQEVSNRYVITEGPPVAQTDEANIYLVAVADTGQPGEFIGCNDSLVPVTVSIDANSNPLRTTLNQLLALDNRIHNATGLYNALYQSDLDVARIQETGEEVSVYLTGDMQLGGVCDEPRFAAQIAETVEQFRPAKLARVFVNDTELDVPDKTFTYIIRPGDTLSHIALSFGVEIADLLDENPQITNPSVIISNQDLTIPAGNEVQPAIILSPTHGEPGTTVQVAVTGLHPNHTYSVGVGERNGNYEFVQTVTSNQNGRLILQVTIPAEASIGERWVVLLRAAGETGTDTSNIFLVSD